MSDKDDAKPRRAHPFKGVATLAGVVIGAALLAQVIKFQDAPDTAQAYVVNTAAATLAPGMTPQPTGTLDTFGTAVAQGHAAETQRAATWTAEVAGTSAGRTATADSWTATAVSAAETLTAAEINEALLGAQLLSGTLTAVPPAQTETQAAQWATAHAENTRAAVVATIDKREADQAAVVDDALYIATLALIGGGALIILGGLAWVVVALSWRVQGKAGGEAQAAVLSVQTRAPIPTTTGGQASAPLDPHTRTEHLALRVLGRMAGADMSGPDATMLTSAPYFGDNRSRDRVAAALCAAGLAESVNGVGVKLLGWTIGELIEAIADGSERLPDPPAPTE